MFANLASAQDESSEKTPFLKKLESYKMLKTRVE